MHYNLAQFILSSLLVDVDRTVLIDEEGYYSRAQLIGDASVRARQWLEAGVQADDFVIVLCGRGLSFWIDILAAWIIGAKTVCIEPDVSDEHGKHILALTQSKWISSSSCDKPSSFAELSSLPALKETVGPNVDARLTFHELPFVSAERAPELAGIIFTSGTTGLPKAVPLTHRALILNALATSRRLQISASDRLMIATPFRFISSISHFVVTLISGAAFFGVERTLMIKDLLTLMVDNDITAFGGSPFHMQFIAMAGKKRLPKLRWAMSSGDHLRVEIIEQLKENFDELQLNVVYGMAELGGRLCIMPKDALEHHAGSVGYPIDGLEIHILDEEFNPCSSGDIGNVYVTGLLAFGGYFGAPETNAEVLTPHGFCTGDKGYFDKSGYVYLTGRSDSVFKRSGLKVSTQVISDALMALDNVNDCYVTSVDDMIEGQVPIAYLSSSDVELDPSLLMQTLRKTLPSNHIPKRFEKLRVIPRTGSGKIDRRAINALIMEASNTPRATE